MKLKELEAAYRSGQQQHEEGKEGKEEETQDHHTPSNAEIERKEGEAPSDSSAAPPTNGDVGKGEGDVSDVSRGVGVSSSSSSDVKESDLDKLKRIQQEKRLHKLRKKIALATAKADLTSTSTQPPVAVSSSDSDSDDSGGSGDEGEVGRNSDYRDYGEVITKMDAKSRITVRNLRIREDTAKYLRNRDPSSAYYDPKTRSMRENPYPDKRPDEVLYAGDNFVRASGDVREIARLHKFVADNADRLEAINTTSAFSSSNPSTTGEGQAEVVDIHAVALPTAAEKLYLAHKTAAEQQKAATKQKILRTYGGSEHLSRPAASLLQVTEGYVEYDDSGRVLKGAERAHARSKYAEDVYEDGHSSVWGSWWDRKEGKWGYACCRATLRHCICVGEAGKMMKEEMERERAKREVKQISEDIKGGEKRKREEEEEEKKVVPATASYSRYSRPPSDSELNEFHRTLRRSDDPMNSSAFTDTT